MSNALHFVNAFYDVYPDCNKHTGYMITLEEGAVSSRSIKQKFDGGSSSEEELITAHDQLPTAIWMEYFVEAQGNLVQHNIMFQDKKSAIFLKTNGKFSSSKRTKHIHNRYLQIVDRIALGELEVIYKSTHEIWGDFFTKSLQGIKFKKFHAKVMNCAVNYQDLMDHEDIDIYGGTLKPESCIFYQSRWQESVFQPIPLQWPHLSINVFLYQVF